MMPHACEKSGTRLDTMLRKLEMTSINRHPRVSSMSEPLRRSMINGLRVTLSFLIAFSRMRPELKGVQSRKVRLHRTEGRGGRYDHSKKR